VEFEFDSAAIGVADIRRPVTSVGSESFARLAVFDLDAGLTEVVEERRHRLAGVGIVRPEKQTDVLAIDIEGFVGRHEVEVSSAGSHGHKREFVAFEFLAVADRESEQVVIKFERRIEVADTNSDVVHIDWFEFHIETTVR
jgi:hypothetical protein